VRKEQKQEERQGRGKRRRKIRGDEPLSGVNP
jgi:hypothetical protein